jgi:hypothetical protein
MVPSHRSPPPCRPVAWAHVWSTVGVSSLLARSMAAAQSVPDIRLSRYTTTSATPEIVQVDPLEAVVQLNLPRTNVQTVGDATGEACRCHGLSRPLAGAKNARSRPLAPHVPRRASTPVSVRQRSNWRSYAGAPGEIRGCSRISRSGCGRGRHSHCLQVAPGAILRPARRVAKRHMHRSIVPAKGVRHWVCEYLFAKQALCGDVP